LMAGGQEGVERMITILRSEIHRTMALLGVSTLDELQPRHVTQLSRMTALSPTTILQRDSS
ncbi:MAG: alpha-hydroxy-acid oxidizing protein, partial [Terracoccus sp.]